MESLLVKENRAQQIFGFMGITIIFYAIKMCLQ